MAQVTSGKVTTGSKNHRHLVLSWSATQSAEKNESYISWELKCEGTATTYNMSAPFKVTIDGEDVYYSTTRIKLFVGDSIKSGTKTIKHNTNGKKTFTISVKAAIYDASYNVEGSGTFELKDIPRKATVVSAPNFYDDENPTITYENLLGNSVTKLEACISLTGEKSDIKYREIEKDGTSYTFELTDAERKLLLENTVGANTRKVRFYVRTNGSTDLLHYIEKTFTVRNPKPTLSPDFEDVNPDTLQLTGDEHIFIKYYSDVKVTTYAQAQKYAELTAVTIQNGNTIVGATETEFYGITDGTFKIVVSDNRNNTTPFTKTIPLIEYFKPTCNIEPKAPDGNGNMDIDISGICFNGSFGAVNNITMISYRIKKDEEDYSNWEFVTPSINGNEYTATAQLKNLDYKSTYTIQAQVVDMLNEVQSVERKVKTKPIFDWSDTDFNFNVPIHYNNAPIDFVTEQKEKDGWFYRKWNSGFCECWKTYTYNTTINTSWGTSGMYVGSPYMPRQTYPVVFKSKPVEQATLQSATSAAWLMIESAANGNNGQYASAIYNVCRASAVSTASDYYISLYVYGMV